MEPEIITLIGQYGIVGLLFYVAIKDFFAYLGKKKEDKDSLGMYDLKNNPLLIRIAERVANQEEKMGKIETNHMKHQEMIIEDMKAFRVDMTGMKLSIERLATIIQERLPRT